MKKRFDSGVNYHPVFKKLFLKLNTLMLMITLGVLPAYSAYGETPEGPVRSDDGTTAAAQQQYTVTGTVKDAATVETMPGVNIQVKGTMLGTITGPDGKYSLSVPSKDAILVFSFIGYTTAEMPVGGKSVVDVSLAAEIEGLDEVVVIGYGSVKKKDLTGSVGSIGTNDLSEVQVTRVDQALTGRVAGVQVKLATGQPGESPQIRIRGVGSISAGVNPLYVVDGFPSVSIETLNPNDIETIDILKDASATAIYGSRGSNGVVIVTTKRGMQGRAKINFNTYYGWQKVSKVPEFLSAKEQANYYYNSIRNWNLDFNHDVTGNPATWNKRVPQTVLDVLSGENTFETDALGAVLKTAPVASYNLSISGGSENIKYAVSGEYIDQDGIILNNNFKRYSTRINLDAKATERLSFKLNLNPSYTQNNNVIAQGGGAGASTSIIGSATSAQPYYPLFNEDGSYFIYRSIDASTDLYNPVALAKEKIDKSSALRVLGNLSAEYKILEDLKFNVMLGATSNVSKGYSFTPNLPVFFGNKATGTDNASFSMSWITEYTLNYSKNFGEHSINALAGYTAQYYKGNSNSLNSNNYPNNLVPFLSAVSSIITGGTGTQSEWSIASELARVNYTYAGKYLLTGSIRRDGSSRFGANNKYGIFPSAALAWRVSDENFMKNIPALNLLKLRASYGETGNDDIGNYASLATINYLKYTTGGVAVGGFAAGVIPNPDLTWETQRQINFGVDFGFFKGRLNLSVDNFYSKNTDLLLNVNVPTATGFNTALQNIGEVKNTGWEFVLNSTNVDKKFKWTTSINLSTFKNEVVKLGPSGDDIISGQNITRIGQPIGMFYGFITDGIFMNAREVEEGPIWNPGLSDETRPGDIRFKDVGGPDGVPDGVIDNNDLTIMGSPYPDFYYGMTNNFSYGNLSLSFNLAGSQGNEVYSSAMTIYKLTRSRSRTLSTERNFWKSEADPGDGKTVRPCDVPTGGLRQASTRYMDTGSYLRINNITLSYEFPQKITDKLKISALTIYSTAINPFIFTKNLSFNPDVSNSTNPLQPGRDNNNYPVPKSIMFGLNASF